MKLSCLMRILFQPKENRFSLSIFISKDSNDLERNLLIDVSIKSENKRKVQWKLVGIKTQLTLLTYKTQLTLLIYSTNINMPIQYHSNY